MSAVQIPDELVRVIERQVAEGRAALAGLADAEGGRTTAIATAADEQALHERLMTRLRDRLAAEG